MPTCRELGIAVLPIPGTKRERYLRENLDTTALRLVSLRPAGDRVANEGETNRVTAKR